MKKNEIPGLSKNPNAKKEIPASSEIKKINYEDAMKEFKGKLDSIELKEKKERESLYKYPLQWKNKDFNLERDGKEFRGFIRRKRDLLIDNILFYAKGNKNEDLQKSISLFNDFYKLYYKNHDYSIDSISQSGNESKNDRIILALNIIKKLKG